MEPVKDLTSSIDTAIITVEGLLQRACLISHQKSLMKVDGLVRVKGVVTKINRYSKIGYLTLVDREHSISVKFDVDQPVLENQMIIVEGTLFLKPSTFYTGLEAYIDGHIVGSWVPTKSPELHAAVPLKKSRYVHLDNFLAEHSIESLMLFGTDTALTDALSHMDGRNAEMLTYRTIRVGKKEYVLDELKSEMPSNVKALAIVRGGDDRTMQVWDDHEVVSALIKLGIPYYTALGHTHSTTLADRYADGTFHTPSALGMAINSSVNRTSRMNALVERCHQLENENSRLEKDSNHQLPAHKESSYPLKAVLLGSVLTVLVFVLIKYFL